ncbi:MAG: hypothetical protein HN742_28175 [Lentisphaerae bacterium]|jgi:hypothetical protein|nr:hypothetical protein [Lentisphaerota bacterium]MBT4818904.1 hypothetical protein [Lentisphaerota bacterium]MBT5606101.1 hypothetical protein [Lentisphaerota bacterium]MBT7058549.1 hypothetical protein [Lentisphaerota bacterium]MBT7845783.1 hypothetical protein [Lentisphaerota bacterium]
MKQVLSAPGAIVLLILGASLSGRTLALDVYKKRFSPPRVYFTHASLNKGGIASGIEGQDNVLALYITAIDREAGQYSEEGFSVSVLLPPEMEILDQEANAIAVTDTTLDGQPYLRVTKPVPPLKVFQRCLRGPWGVDDAVWYRLRPGQTSTQGPRPIQAALYYNGELCFTDDAKLRIYPPLAPPPPVDPRHFRFWLHYGPHVRMGHWDELAKQLRTAGINAIQFTVASPNRLDYVREMRNRGFYTIIQRGASYSAIHKDNLKGALTSGPAWFAAQDKGTMETYLPYGDAVLWDFEPTPTRLELDEWTLNRFRQVTGVPDETPLTEETIKEHHFPAWIAFRQDSFATCVRNWAEFCRSVKPDIETILTEGRANMFDPPGQIDYARVADDVTFCDPMNYTGIDSVRVLQKWQEHAPKASFTGCQNVAQGSHHNVFISPKTIMLQIVSSALVGSKGTDIYPGHAMDAENFVLTNRAMGLLGRNQRAMFASPGPTTDIVAAPIPKESVEIKLGDGRTIRNTFPDWERDAVIRTYRDPVTNDDLVVIVNWNANEPCYVRINVPEAGDRLILEQENNRCLTLNAQPRVPAGKLAEGIFLVCPPFDFRGFTLRRWSTPLPQTASQLSRVRLEDIAARVDAYVTRTDAATATRSTGDLSLGFDDCNADGKFEYVIASPSSKVWLSQNGTISRWNTDDGSVATAGLGLCRDMIWLPQPERANAGMDAVMTLDSKQLSTDQVTMVFSKNVTLEALGGMSSLSVRKTFTFPADAPTVSVAVEVVNTSVTMDTPSLPFSYRVHNHIDYGEAPSRLWVSDGAHTTSWEDTTKHYSIPNTGLTETDRAAVFGQGDTCPDEHIRTFGDYLPDQTLQLVVHPRRPSQLLQILRWGRRANRGGSGTLEWIYRPFDLKQGATARYEYALSLRAGEAQLQAPPPEKSDRIPSPAGPNLLFHAAFDGNADSTTRHGVISPTITGTPAYEATRDGQGIRVTGGTELTFPAEGLLNLERGKLHIRFKPLWDGTDQKTHYFLTARPRPGFVYFGKLADGRLLLNMFDRENKQHYPHHTIRTMKADTWHTATVTWDAPKGAMALFLDGKKVRESRQTPWSMGQLNNAHPECRLVIPGTADTVIDDIKIWNRP